MTRRTALVPLLALSTALVLTGCGSDEDGGTTSGVPTPSAAATGAADGGSFPGTAEIVTALNDKGLSCEEPMEGTYPGVSEAQSCILGGTEDVVLLRFATPAEKQEFVSTKDALASAVVGQDWAVQTVLPATAEKVAAALGGELLTGST